MSTKSANDFNKRFQDINASKYNSHGGPSRPKILQKQNFQVMGISRYVDTVYWYFVSVARKVKNNNTHFTV